MSPATVPEGAAFAYSGALEESVKEVILTAEGHNKLKEEIEYLSTVKRREVAERIKQAREFGDITENSEYDDAKNEQAMLEHRIATLEERLTSARVVTKKEIPTGVVAVGTKVRLRDIDANETIEYHIVGSAEANPAEHKLSNESPVGKAIMGHKKGETVEVAAPRGSLKFKIMEIKAA
jgi:transcription elongation factor GreA